MHQVDHAQELGEDDDLLAAVQRLLEQLLPEVPFAGGELVGPVELTEGEGGMVADLLQEVAASPRDLVTESEP